MGISKLMGLWDDSLVYNVPLCFNEQTGIWVMNSFKQAGLGLGRCCEGASGTSCGTCVFSLVLLTLNSDVLFSSYCDGLLLGLYYDLVGLMGLSSR